MTARTDSDSLLLIAQRAVDLASPIFTSSSPSHVVSKGDRDMVSDLDIRIQETVREFLSSETPDIPFLGEEGEQRAATTFRDLTWVLDPVDGTANLLRRIPTCGISLALIQHDHPILGVVDLPFLHSRYHASLNGGAFRQERQLKIANTPAMAEAIATLGDYAVGADAERRNELRFALSRQLARAAQRVRMFGSAAVDLAWLAEAKTDISVVLSNKPWDIAAGAAIAREAGAVVMDLDGAPYSLQSKATLATNPYLREALLSLVTKTIAEITQPGRS